MMRKEIEFRAGTRQGGNQFASVSTCKCATCERPGTDKVDQIDCDTLRLRVPSHRPYVPHTRFQPRCTGQGIGR